MAYQDKQQAQNAKQDHKARPEEQFVPDQRSFGMPNSLMRAAPMVPPPGTPNSVMREMDPEDNSGGLFRSRGFDPSLGVHELSHTVRRESVSAPVRLSAPAGTIQRNPTRNNGSGPDMAEYAKKHPNADIAEMYQYFTVLVPPGTLPPDADEWDDEEDDDEEY